MRRISLAALLVSFVAIAPVHASEGGGGEGGGPMAGGGAGAISAPRPAPQKLPPGSSTRFSDGSAITFSGPGLTEVAFTTSSGYSISGRLISDPRDRRSLWIYSRVITFRADYGSTLRAYFLPGGMAKIDKIDGSGRQPETVWQRR